MKNPFLETPAEGFTVLLVLKPHLHTSSKPEKTHEQIGKYMDKRHGNIEKKG